MNYQITCLCGHRFFVSEQQVSLPVTCPACKRQLQPVISAHASAPTPPAKPTPAASAPASADTSATEPVPATAEATKRCPFCGETILAVARKCKHCGEFLDRHTDPSQLAPGAAPAPSDTPPVFSLSVSQWDNFWKYIICLTLLLFISAALILVKQLREYAPIGVSAAVALCAFIAWFFYLSARNSRCYIRPTRIDTETGVLSKDLNSLEIFRITDLELKQGIIQRLLGIGTVRLTSSDPKTPELLLYQIPKARRVYKYLQDQIPIATRQRGAVFFEK